MKSILIFLQTALFFCIPCIAKANSISKTQSLPAAKSVPSQAESKYKLYRVLFKLDTGTGKNDTVAKTTKPKFDSTATSQEPRNYYVGITTNTFVKSVGGFKERFSPSFEVGRTYGIFDIGLAFGRFNYVKKSADSTKFILIRPTINVFSKGRFSEAICFGAGYIFKAKQGLMTEICNSINFNITEIWTLSILQGYYFIDGTNDNRSTQYMGLNVTYNFLKWHTLNHARKKKALLN